MMQDLIPGAVPETKQNEVFEMDSSVQRQVIVEIQIHEMNIMVVVALVVDL